MSTEISDSAAFLTTLIRNTQTICNSDQGCKTLNGQINFTIIFKVKFALQ